MNPSEGNGDEPVLLGARIDVVVPVYNEADCLHELVRRLDKVRGQLVDDDIELNAILVDDGSSDGSSLLIDELVEEHSWLRAIHLARNFGHQPAMTAGLDAATADYVCVIDADLQDPPELIPDMLTLLRTKQVDVVYGVREQRHGESRFKLKTANVFYRTLRRASGLDIPLDTGDFRVMTARVVDALRALPEHNRFVRALVPWLGYDAVGYSYTRDRRYAGETKYPLRKMAVLAAHAIFALSTAPIRLVQGLGLVLSGAGAVFAVVLGILQATGAASVGLLAWVLAALTVQTGLVLTAVGVVGGYVFRIQDEVKGRPLYVRTDITPAAGARASKRRAVPPPYPEWEASR